MGKVHHVSQRIFNPQLSSISQLEVLGGSFQKRDKVASVVGGPTAYVYAGDYLGLYAAHQMALYPLPVIYFPAILFVVPTDEPRRAEARRVNREVGFNRLQRKAA
jgi:hypothetical protein